MYIEKPDKEPHCEQCKFYIFQDSGYGLCRRYPPMTLLIKVFPRFIYDTQYPLVAWCQKACGEFRRKAISR